MRSDAIDRAATLVAGARAGRYQIPGFLPPELRPATLVDAYHIQKGVADRLGHQIIGWKIGASSKKIQEVDNLPGPIIGRIYKPCVHWSPAQLSAELFVTCRLCESEFVFIMGDDLPEQDAPYTMPQVLDAVKSFHPGIEAGDVVFPLAERSSLIPYFGIAVDNAGGGEFVIGPEAPDWRRYNLAEICVEISFNGKLVNRGIGSEVQGDPAFALTWLANELRNHGERLRAGQIAFTGTCTRFSFADPGDEALATFGPLGEVRISFGR